MPFSTLTGNRYHGRISAILLPVADVAEPLSGYFSSRAGFSSAGFRHIVGIFL
jgi:hypothetical protein